MAGLGDRAASKQLPEEVSNLLDLVPFIQLFFAPKAGADKPEERVSRSMLSCNRLATCLIQWRALGSFCIGDAIVFLQHGDLD